MCTTVLWCVRTSCDFWKALLYSHEDCKTLNGLGNCTTTEPRVEHNRHVSVCLAADSQHWFRYFNSDEEWDNWHITIIWELTQELPCLLFTSLMTGPEYLHWAWGDLFECVQYAKLPVIWIGLRSNSYAVAREFPILILEFCSVVF